MSKGWASQFDFFRSPIQLAENPILVLVLGGAAVYRCDKRIIFSAGFSR
jgi:hypothetical protein